VTPYLVGFRHSEGVYNINILLYHLRKLLVLITNLSFYRHIILVQTVATENPLPIGLVISLKRIAKKTFLLSRFRWLGGSLSNYRIILKLLYSLLNLPASLETPRRIRYKRYLQGFNLKRVPYLPSLSISLVDHHWSLNEAKSLGIKTVQCLQINYRSLFADINLVMGDSPATLTYLCFLFKEAIISGTLQDRVYFNKYLKRYSDRKTKNPNRLLRQITKQMS
jgi:ribosomal protein S2